MKHTDTALHFLILQFFCFTLHKYSSCHCSFSLKRISSIISVSLLLDQFSLNSFVLLSFLFFRSMLVVSLRRYLFLYTYYNNIIIIKGFACTLLKVQVLKASSFCSSSQVMWNAAVHAEYLHDHGDYGFETGDVRFSWE